MYVCTSCVSFVLSGRGQADNPSKASEQVFTNKLISRSREVLTPTGLYCHTDRIFLLIHGYKLGEWGTGARKTH